MYIYILSKGKGRGIHDLSTTVLLSLIEHAYAGAEGPHIHRLKVDTQKHPERSKILREWKKKSQTERNVSADQCSTTHILSSRSDLMVSIAGEIQGESWRQLLHIFVIWAKHYWLFISLWKRNIANLSQ